MKSSQKQLNKLSGKSLTHQSYAVYEELAKFGASIGNPGPKQEKGSVNLLELKNKKGQTAYDRYLELTGTVTLGSKGILKEALEHVVTSDKYLGTLDDPLEDFVGSRKDQIREEIGKYRERAYKTLMKEFPEIRGRNVVSLKDSVSPRL